MNYHKNTIKKTDGGAAYLRCFLVVLLMVCCMPWAQGQKLIQYEAEVGRRFGDDPDTWVLSRHVKATHEGMTLYADSALLNTVRNDFTAYGRIRIVLNDTSFITGAELFYDGFAKVLDIWDDTAVFVDGKTTLISPHFIYDRNTSTATYATWGHATSGERILDSREGHYNSDTKIFFIYNKVVLQDGKAHLHTDTLIYNTTTEVAHFESPTYIYSDSTTLYSECGDYYADSSYAISTAASRVENGNKRLSCDTLRYFSKTDFGQASGNVCIEDTLNHIVCHGRYGVTNQQENFSFVTDSALVTVPYEGDTAYLHADTLYAFNDSSNSIRSVTGFHRAKIFRKDVQAMSDSIFYSADDSLIRIFYHPVVWYEQYQLSADSMDLYLDSAGVRIAYLNSNCLAVERVDATRFNQLQGKNDVLHFVKGEPTYADILGNAQMVYYITDADSLGNEALVGVNCGVGSDMRLYFEKRQIKRLVTFGNPDMKTYPEAQLPDDQRFLPGFKWHEKRRPLAPKDVFTW